MEVIHDDEGYARPADFKYPDTGADVTAETFSEEGADRFLHPTNHTHAYQGNAVIVRGAQRAGEIVAQQYTASDEIVARHQDA